MALPSHRTRKYNAKIIKIDGICFDSQKEANRYSDLKMLQKAGQIWDLQVHKTFSLDVMGVRIGLYEADFTYYEDKPETRVNGCLVVEDVKGYHTRLYKWKKAHFEAQYGMKIMET